MGYIAFIDGSGWTVELDDNGAHLVKSIITCEMCEDATYLPPFRHHLNTDRRLVSVAGLCQSHHHDTGINP